MSNSDRLILAGIIAAAVIVVGVAARQRAELDARRLAEAERWRAALDAYALDKPARPKVSRAGVLLGAGMGAASGALACAAAGPWGVVACGALGAAAGGVSNYAQQRKGMERGGKV